MTKEEAEKLGYKVIWASPFEIGLTKNGQGIRTWWAGDMGRDFPNLTHPKIQEAIRITEEMNLKP